MDFVTPIVFLLLIAIYHTYPLRFWHYRSYHALGDENRKGYFGCTLHLSPIFFALNCFDFGKKYTMKSHAGLATRSFCFQCNHGCKDNNHWVTFETEDIEEYLFVLPYLCIDRTDLWMVHESSFLTFGNSKLGRQSKLKMSTY